MKTVLITGANRGLGLCRYYLNAGFKVFASCRNLEAAIGLKKIACETRTLEIIQLDVASETSIKNLAVTLDGIGCEINLLINNAGISAEEDFGQWTQCSFVDSFKINSVGPALITQTVFPHMDRHGKIVFVSSGLASIEQNINPDGHYESYSMSKASLSILCRRLASKRLDKRLIFAALSPGWVRTDMGGEDAPTSAATAAAEIASFISQLEPNHSGKFFDTLGNEIPW